MKVGFFGLLVLMFLFLMLTGQISWWWLLVPALLVLGALGVLAAIAITCFCIDASTNGQEAA